MNQYDDLIQDLDLPNVPRRASRNQKSHPRTQETEAVIPFVVATPSELQTSSSKDTQMKSLGASVLTKLKLVVASIMVLFSLCMLVLIIVMWPILVHSTEFVIKCNPSIGITTDCPHIEAPRK